MLIKCLRLTIAYEPKNPYLALGSYIYVLYAWSCEKNPMDFVNVWKREIEEFGPSRYIKAACHVIYPILHLLWMSTGRGILGGKYVRENLVEAEEMVLVMDDKGFHLPKLRNLGREGLEGFGI